MRKVYEVSFNHQREPECYGLYPSKEEALRFLQLLNITKVVYENAQYTSLEGGYSIRERLVA